MKLTAVKVGDRHRTDIGDIGALMASMRDIGTLLQPIVLDKDLNLIAGFRRLEAAKRLGWPTVSCRIVNGLDDAVKALHAERDENTCRKDFTPSELFSMGQAIEAIEAPKAAERRLAGLNNSSLGSVEPNEGNGRTNDKVAEALGVSAAHYRRAKRVVTAAEDQVGKIRAYKLVDADGRSPIQSTGKLTYVKGETVECKKANTDPAAACAAGINVATLDWCLREWLTGRRILVVEFTAKDIAAIPHGSDGKFRVHRCKVVGEKTDLVALGLVQPEGAA